jgi:tRNA dimethylallyltransferase
VPHHLIDVADLSHDFNAAQFVSLAHQAVTEIRARGRLPIFCGGTGLYFKAFLAGLGDSPPADAAVRTALEATPLPDLLRELAQRDPITFARIDRHNPRRVIRALEVSRLTGRPFSTQRANWQPSALNPQPSPTFIVLARSSADLRRRIDTRVDAMFQRGLVAETEHLLKCGLAQNRTAMQALGYRQVVECLGGERSLPDTIELVKTRTRQFAKRQMTWFRRQLPTHWIHLEPEATLETQLNMVLAALASPPPQLKNSPS